jgi:hypothetical protein
MKLLFLLLFAVCNLAAAAEEEPEVHLNLPEKDIHYVPGLSDIPDRIKFGDNLELHNDGSLKYVDENKDHRYSLSLKGSETKIEFRWFFK